MVLRELGDLEASRGHIEKSLQIFRTLFTDESHQVGTTLCSLADTEAQLGGTSADSLYRTGIEKLQRFFKASHPEVVDCQIRYADFLAIQTRYAEAEASLLQVRQNISADPEAGGLRNLPRVALSLAAMYEAWGKPEEAATYKTLADSLQ